VKLVDTNRFYLPGTDERFLHMATIHHGVREFLCFQDVVTSTTYIEEITGGTLSFIEDDSLAQGLSDFLTLKGVLSMVRPALPDDQWLSDQGESPQGSQS
jgi:hypothetical protein